MNTTMNSSTGTISQRCLNLLTDPIFLLQETPEEQYIQGLAYVVFIANVLILFVSASSNILVIRTMVKTPSIRTSSNLLITGLASTDLGVCFASQLPYIVAKIADLMLEARTFCIASEVYNFTMWTFGMGSFFILCACTIDRFLAIKLHLRYQHFVTNNRCVILLVSIHVFTILTGIVRLFIKPKAFFPFAASLFGTPTITCIIISILIAKAVNRHTTQIAFHEEPTPSSLLVNILTFKKTLYAVLYVTLAFFMSYIPFFITMAVGVHSRLSPEIKLLRTFGSTLLMFNGVINPWIYFWRIKELRYAVKRTLFKDLGFNPGIGTRNSLQTNSNHTQNTS